MKVPVLESWAVFSVACCLGVVAVVSANWAALAVQRRLGDVASSSWVAVPVLIAGMVSAVALGGLLVKKTQRARWNIARGAALALAGYIFGAFVGGAFIPIR
jgi:hypothetical protein